MKCLACDFGGSAVKYALVNEDGTLCLRGRARAPIGSLEDFLDVIQTLLGQLPERADGLALSLPGSIDGESGMHYGSGAYGSILQGKNIRELLQPRFRIPVSVENDGKCGALAELWKGELQNARNGAVLILGTGIGGGVIVDRKLVRGRDLAAGEFSYSLNPAGAYHPMDGAWLNVGMLGVTYKLCKRKNLSFAAQDAGALLEKYDPLLKSRFPSFSDPPTFQKADGKQFFRWVEEGDPDAAAVYRELLRALAAMIQNIQVCIAPEAIVLGGGLSRAPRLLPDLRQELQSMYQGCLIGAFLYANVVTSQFLDECNLLGAMYHFLQQEG